MFSSPSTRLTAALKNDRAGSAHPPLAWYPKQQPVPPPPPRNSPFNPLTPPKPPLRSPDNLATAPGAQSPDGTNVEGSAYATENAVLFSLFAGAWGSGRFKPRRISHRFIGLVQRCPRL